MIITSTLIDYTAGLKMGQTDDKRKRKKYLILSLITNLGLLGTFKYFNFFNESFRALFSHYNLMLNIPELKVLLPVGISFYTFQTLSYSIDVYRGVKKPERHLGMFALYVSFFPQLVAGPIERSTRLLPQLFEKKKYSYENFSSGMKQIIWGYFKKLVVADRLAIIVNSVYNNQSEHSGITLLLATLFFSFQVYCDFSAYSDIAIGSARIMGYDLMENFRRPFLAKSFPEVWRRWHISLTTWFKDYVYIPMGGSRVSQSRWLFNVIVVFTISGLWHGANWTFIIWGAIHGICLASSRVFAGIRQWFVHLIRLDRFPRFHNFIRILITFTLFSLLAMFFRANSLSDAFQIAEKVFLLKGSLYVAQTTMLLYGLFGIGFLMMVEIKQEFFDNKFSLFDNRIPIIRHLSYAFLVLIILAVGVFDGGQFIYFQF